MISNSQISQRLIGLIPGTNTTATSLSLSTTVYTVYSLSYFINMFSLQSAAIHCSWEKKDFFYLSLLSTIYSLSYILYYIYSILSQLQFITMLSLQWAAIHCSFCEICGFSFFRIQETCTVLRTPWVWTMKLLH